MTDLFKGYVKTKDKHCTEKFKNKTDFKTLEQVKDLREYAGILAEETILIDVDDYEQSEILLNIVDDLQLKCKVLATTRGKHFYFKNNGIDSCKTHTKLACGLEADIKVGVKNSYAILKYDGKEREVLYDIFDEEEYEEVPKWLFPVKSNADFLGMSDGDGRNQALFNYILTLQNEGFTNDQAKTCIEIINKYVLKKSLAKSELNTILRDDSFSKPVFYKGKEFLFDKFALFMINNHHIIKISSQLYIYRDGVYVWGRSIIESEMIKIIPNLSQQKRREVLAYIEVSIVEDTPQAEAKYIAFRNGIYNIETDELMPFSPDIVLINKIEYDFNPKAYSEIADMTLYKLACNDNNVRDLLEEVIGYTFYRRNELRKSFILIGDKSNGKSTYLDMIRTLLGDRNISSLDLGELNSRFKTAELVGKLANIGDDIGSEFIPDPSIFKKIVSGDRLNVERKGIDPYEFDNYSKMLFSANDIPRIKDKSGAVISRLIIIPFEATFSSDDEDYDPFIKYKLRKEDVMEYLIQIGLDGLKRVLSTSMFTICKKVQKEIEEYEELNNPIILFLKEIDTISDVYNQPTKDVYSKYLEFCLSNSFQPMSNVEFSRQLKKRLNVDIINKTIKGKKYRLFIPS